ncbi:MAG: hypothetical protein AUH75_09995 [Gemmatimonadetes bacterium 13_1_40CM_4_65_7]|nr:MAG: hypothetical protein AUH75_09995 [Gemmatimonadetes bacterium 13_1_40CM_4_65_7]
MCRDEVDDASHGVRTVEYRAGTANNLKPFYCVERELGDVDCPEVLIRKGTAVEENERALSAEAAGNAAHCDPNLLTIASVADDVRARKCLDGGIDRRRLSDLERGAIEDIDIVGLTFD